MKKYSCGTRFTPRSRLYKTVAIIAAAGFLSFSAALHAACTAQSGIGTEVKIDTGTLNAPDDAPIGTTLAVITQGVPESGRVWDCPTISDTVTLTNSHWYVRSVHITMRMKLGNGNWLQSNDEVLFRGPGQYRVPEQTYEISYTKLGEVISGATPQIDLAKIKSADGSTSRSYETRVLLNPFRIVGKTCTISPTSQTVTLTAKAPDLNATGYGPYSHFNFQLSNCPATIYKVTATMTGTPDAADPTVFANGGTAQEIGIEVSTEDGAIVAPNVNEAAKWATDAPAAKNYAFRARVKKTGNVKAGTISAVTQIRFDYN